VVAQARSRQGWAMERLGQSTMLRRSRRSARLFTAAGDRMGAASALQTIGHMLYDKGNFAERAKRTRMPSSCP